MSGEELIKWLADECRFRKLLPTDSAMILILRSLFDVEVMFRTIRHDVQPTPATKGVTE